MAKLWQSGKMKVEAAGSCTAARELMMGDGSSLEACSVQSNSFPPACRKSVAAMTDLLLQALKLHFQ